MSEPADDQVLRRLARFGREDCPEDAELQAYIAASGEPMEVLQAHLAACPRCINRLVDLRLLAADDPATNVPAGLTARVERSVARHLAPSTAGRGKRFRLPWSLPVWGGGAAVAAAVALAVLLVMRGTEQIPVQDLTPRGSESAEMAQEVLAALAEGGVRVLTAGQVHSLRVDDEWLLVGSAPVEAAALPLAPPPLPGAVVQLFATGAAAMSLPLPAPSVASWRSPGGVERQAWMALLERELPPGTVAVDGQGRLVGVVLFGELLAEEAVSYLLVQPELEKIIADAGKNATPPASSGWRHNAPDINTGDEK